MVGAGRIEEPVGGIQFQLDSGNVAFRATEARQEEVKERMAAAGIEPLMDAEDIDYVRVAIMKPIWPLGASVSK